MCKIYIVLYILESNVNNISSEMNYYIIMVQEHVSRCFSKKSPPNEQELLTKGSLYCFTKGVCQTVTPITARHQNNQNISPLSS